MIVTRSGNVICYDFNDAYCGLSINAAKPLYEGQYWFGEPDFYQEQSSESWNNYDFRFWRWWCITVHHHHHPASLQCLCCSKLRLQQTCLLPSRKTSPGTRWDTVVIVIVGCGSPCHHRFRSHFNRLWSPGVLIDPPLSQPSLLASWAQVMANFMLLLKTLSR